MNEQPAMTLNVMIVYDDYRAYKRAMRTLVRLTSQLDDSLTVVPLPWNFAFLEKPDWRALATADASKAEMLLVSTSSEDALPRDIERWFETCLDLKRNSPMSVVALLGTPDDLDGSDSSRLQFLSRTAKAAGLDFFAPLALAAESGATAL